MVLPSAEIVLAEVVSVQRQKSSVPIAIRDVNRVHKLLEEAGIKLATVATDTVVDVPDCYLLSSRHNIRELHQRLIDADTADVVEIGCSDDRVVNFRFADDTQFNECDLLPSVGAYTGRYR